jgi:uncharacterized protein
MQFALIALLVVVIAVLVARAITRERREYGRFKLLTDTRDRQKTYRKWLLESFALFGGLSVVVGVASAAFVSPVLVETAEWAPIAWMSRLFATGAGIGFAIGGVVALLALLIVPVFALRNEVDVIPTVGDIGALLPRNRAELRWTALLAINAGVVEEVFFRLAMPALLFGIIGNGPVAFLCASVLFGMLHIYQGAVGVVATTVLGLLLALIYVLTGSIVVVIVVHALIDLRSLVLVPVVVGKILRADSAQGGSGSVVPDKLDG